MRGLQVRGSPTGDGRPGVTPTGLEDPPLTTHAPGVRTWTAGQLEENIHVLHYVLNRKAGISP